MKNIEIGKEYFLTENAKCFLGLPDGLTVRVSSILDENIFPYPIEVVCDEMVPEWKINVRKEELIHIPEYI